MPGSDWNHFVTLTVRGRAPYLDSGIDPKGAAHNQYPLVVALEREARVSAKEALKNNIPEGEDIRIEIVCRRDDFDSKARVSPSRIIGGITNVLQGMFYFSERDIREVSYAEEGVLDGGIEGYEVSVYSR